MARILAVGNATLDIINIVDSYPHEDQEVRAEAQQRRRGGNATNTLAILAQLGHHGHWAGTVADEPDGQAILDDLHDYGVDTSAVSHQSQGKVPTSYITLNRQNGSRTIVHYRDLPEYQADDFAAIDLAPFDWLHFEGRNLEQLQRMMADARARRPDLPISIEVEKARPQIEQFFNSADYLFFSRDFAQARGFKQAEAFLHAMHQQAPHAQLSCTWGAGGAYAMDASGRLFYAAATTLERVVDTLGAGDTFNGGMIDALVRGESLKEALLYATGVAGRKCGVYGLRLQDD